MLNVWYSQENNVSIIQLIRLDKEKENTAKKMITLAMSHDFLIVSNVLFICDFFYPYLSWKCYWCNYVWNNDHIIVDDCR